MSTQSGIAVSEELLEAFKAAQEGDVRVLKVKIENERLVPAGTLSIKSNEADDFDSIPSLLDPKDEPAYILVKLDGSQQAQAEWLLATYTPDNAKVRSKMLYASTKATLSRQLAEGNFKHTLFASTPDELSSAGYKRFLRHQESSAPLTSREREMADLKEAEGTEIIGSSDRRSHAGAQLGMQWDQGVEEAIESLSRGENKIVQLGIDVKTEKIVLLGTPDSLSVPSHDPSYTFYGHSQGIVFIYCCPDTSPVRGRMVYSANCQPVVQDVKKRGVEVVKKLETSTPSEITAEYVDAEFTSQQEEQNSRSATPAAGFSRPARPGKKR